MEGSDFEQSVAYVIGIARELQRHCISERTGTEMPVGSSIKQYVIQCADTALDEIKIVRVPGVPGPDDSDPSVRAALSVTQSQGRRVARVAFSSGLNRCWTRFVVCKELMHLLLDRDGDRTPEAMHQLAAMVTPIPNPYAKMTSEVMAALGALEYLLPWSERPSGLGEDDDAALAVATKFRLPRHWVEFFYRNDVNFKSISDAYHSELDRTQG